MDNIQKRYGYTGQGLRVNLTTGKITKEDLKTKSAELLWAFLGRSSSEDSAA